MSSSICNLKRLGVLVTRPLDQGKALCQLIDDNNGRSMQFPGIEISEPENLAEADASLLRLKDYRIAIFVSPNAVTRCLEILGDTVLPDKLKLAAVGKDTADALAHAGYPVDIVPDERFDGEALLDTPELQAKKVRGKSVLIIRGVGGVPLLGDTLAERGAAVAYAEVYERRVPDRDPTELLDGWTVDVGVVTVTSLEILENLWALFGEKGQQQFLNTPLLVISERSRTRARELGFRTVLLAPKLDDLAILHTLCGWVSGEPV